MVLPPRQPGRALNPTKEQVAQMVTRLALGPEKEPEWGKLYETVVLLDFRDYPEAFAPVVSEAGWLNSVAYTFKPKFRQNDEPAFIGALIAYYEREHDKLPTEHERIQYPQLLARMTSSPALIPALIKGMQTTTFDTIWAGCASALGSIHSVEVVQHAVEQARIVNETFKATGTNAFRREVWFEIVASSRNADALSNLERELSQTKDPALALQIRAAITGTKQGWPRVITAEQWKMLKEQ